MGLSPACVAVASFVVAAIGFCCGVKLHSPRRPLMLHLQLLTHTMLRRLNPLRSSSSAATDAAAKIVHVQQGQLQESGLNFK